MILHSPPVEAGEAGLSGLDVDCAVVGLDRRWPLRLPDGWRLCQDLDVPAVGEDPLATRAAAAARDGGWVETRATWPRRTPGLYTAGCRRWHLLGYYGLDFLAGGWLSVAQVLARNGLGANRSRSLALPPGWSGARGRCSLPPT
jgi:hypothetical protein